MLYVPAWTSAGVPVPLLMTSVPPPCADHPVPFAYSTSPLPARFKGDAKHAPAAQKPPLQLASVAHVAAQANPPASHWYAPQDVFAPTPQVPKPLQVDAACAVALEQLAARQTVPATCLRQAPAPSQKPSLPQVEGSLAEHSARGSVP